LISLLAAMWAFKCRTDVLALEQDSVIVEGKIVRLWVSSANNGLHYRLAYEYPPTPHAEARWLQGQDELSERDFNRLAEGGPVAVKLCRSDPANHVVAGGRPRAFSNPLALPFVLGILSILALAGVMNVGWWWMCRGPRSVGAVLVLRAKRTTSTAP
jgi:hypothetical protein